MPSQLFATIRNGKIEPSEPIDLPEGTEIIVTIDSRSSSEKDEEWYALSLQGLTFFSVCSSQARSNWFDR